MGGQPASILYGLDVDRVAVLANNIRIDLNDTTQWNVRIENGGVFLDVNLKSNAPTIKCIGHFKAKSFYVFTINEGWADELCPDFNLNQMFLSIKLVPGARNGELSVTDVQVSTMLQPAGTSSEVLNFLAGVTTKMKEQIATTVRAKLLEPQTRQDVGELLTKGAKFKFSDMCHVVTAQVIGDDLVMLYTTPIVPGASCPGAIFG